MLRILLSFILLVFLWQLVPGQTVNECSYQPPRQGETWCFYNNIKLKFHGGSLTQSAIVPSVLPFGKGCASISDVDGNLVMFTNGMKLWDKNVFALSSNLDGDLGSTQTALFVPNPQENGVYYLFTTHLLYPAPVNTKGLNVLTFDINNAITSDTSPIKRHLLDKTAEKLTGVRHANGYDYWVVAHGWDNNSFYSYRVTSAGVDSNAVVSNVGMVHSGTLASRNSAGYMKLSPDGSRLALVNMGMNVIEWFDFDHSSGTVSNVRQIPLPDAGLLYGLEFSPNNNFLYFTTVNITTNTTNNLYQVDLSAGSAPLLINLLPLDITGLQLAVDGKIYVARFLNPFLGVIENPNRPGTACNFNENGWDLGGVTAQRGLPNYIQSYFNIPAITYDTKCFGDGTLFNLTNTANIDSVNWDFGDPTSGASNFDQVLQPVHTFSSAGTFNVKVKEWYNSQSFDTPVTVVINKLPPKSFGPGLDSMYILPGSAYILDGGDFMKTYLWKGGSSSQYLEVSQPGYYDVIIVDTNCCQQSDTIKILLLDLFVPSAFSPNFDGNNDRFHVTGPTQGIENYHFYVYNRWGQLLWEANSFNDSWDGTFNGTECPVGVYTWVMKFGVTGLLNRDKVVKRGVITLVK
jgi:gliding motility-associated-like protein